MSTWAAMEALVAMDIDAFGGHKFNWYKQKYNAQSAPLLSGANHSCLEKKLGRSWTLTGGEFRQIKIRYYKCEPDWRLDSDEL